MNSYSKNIAQAEETIKQLTRSINALAILRLVVLVAGLAICFYMAQLSSLLGVMIGFFGLIIGFSGLVWRQSRLMEERRRWQAFLVVNQNEVNVQQGGLNVYDDGAGFASPQHPYASDLDVYGPHSLYAFINRAATLQGRNVLGDWLGEAAEVEIIHVRQEAVQELSAIPEWVQAFQVDLFPMKDHKTDLKTRLQQFVNFSYQEFSNPFFKAYVRLAPYLVILLLIGGIWLPLSMKFGVGLMVLHLFLSLGFAGRITQLGGRFEKISGVLKSFSNAFKRLENHEWKSPGMRAIKSTLVESSTQTAIQVSSAIAQLSVILEKLDYRLNMLVGSLMNMLFLWDFRQVIALQDWRSNHGEHVLKGLAIIGEAEALNSLAVLAINHPNWTFPVVQAYYGHCTIQFEELNHPLLPIAQAIPNSYSNAQHKIGLITGSNMAGKSTFLRTVGINAVLAFAGAPICGKFMRITRFQLLTYMRIKDSIQESTSTFKAELDRMKMVLDSVEAHPNSFFLIDEMLRGTNSVDKYRGSKAIIKHLINASATGLVATHDLQLAELENEFPQIVRNYHFDIQVIDNEMVFDYRLKDGACTIFNASLLLKGIGIDLDPSA